MKPAKLNTGKGEILKTYPLSTGYLFTGQYSKGQLETLSIGDYGKVNYL